MRMITTAFDFNSEAPKPLIIRMTSTVQHAPKKQHVGKPVRISHPSIRNAYRPEEIKSIAASHISSTFPTAAARYIHDKSTCPPFQCRHIAMLRNPLNFLSRKKLIDLEGRNAWNMRDNFSAVWDHRSRKYLFESTSKSRKSAVLTHVVKMHSTTAIAETLEHQQLQTSGSSISGTSRPNTNIYS